MTRTAYFDGPLPRILAHRGLAATAPENSLFAFRDALGLPDVVLETDARATADGVAVLVHDVKPEGWALPVARTVLVDVMDHHPGVTTLTAALTSFPDARFNIDVKDRRAALPVAAAIRSARAEHRVLITSFRDGRRRATLRWLTPVATSASGERIALALAGLRLGSLRIVRAALAGTDAVQIPERLAGLDATTPAVIDLLHAAGVEVHFWVINDPERMRELVRRGADGVVTDHPDLAVAALR
ncbi:MAG TPA: glycerophosphodiester phosphodiesterase family protein [Amnibacterium sp.]|nr:glycerophosphodiester phosphodiesterase family protein [Amnibacterium sp.]